MNTNYEDSSNYSARELSPDDLSDLAQLRAVVEGTHEPPYLEVEDVGEETDHFGLILNKGIGNQPLLVGAITLRPSNEATSFEMRGTWLGLSQRHLEAARKVLELAERRALERGAERALIASSGERMEMYIKLGFWPTGVIINRGDHHELEMSKRLKRLDG